MYFIKIVYSSFKRSIHFGSLGPALIVISGKLDYVWISIFNLLYIIYYILLLFHLLYFWIWLTTKSSCYSFYFYIVSYITYFLLISFASEFFQLFFRIMGNLSWFVLLVLKTRSFLLIDSESKYSGDIGLIIGLNQHVWIILKIIL